MQVAGQRRRLRRDPLHEIAVGADDVGVMVNDLIAGAVEAGRQHPLRDRQPHRVRKPLSKRPRRHLDTRSHAAFGMAGTARPPLPEPLELLQRQVVAAQMDHRIQQHRGVPRRHTRVPRAGRLHRVDRQRPDGIDHELIQIADHVAVRGGGVGVDDGVWSQIPLFHTMAPPNPSTCIQPQRAIAPRRRRPVSADTDAPSAGPWLPHPWRATRPGLPGGDHAGLGDLRASSVTMTPAASSQIAPNVLPVTGRSRA